MSLWKLNYVLSFHNDNDLKRPVNDGFVQTNFVAEAFFGFAI